jgi:3-hydroxyacyl-[acyl-carrier-protein] dehydratase
MISDNTNEKTTKTNEIVLDVEQIQRLIPHRAPFLLVEKVKDIVPFESAVGIKCVSINEPHFAGHFPEFKIMPGVLIIEALAQTSAVLVMHSNNLTKEGFRSYFLSIDSARFRRPIVPGDLVELHVKKEFDRGGIWKFSGKAIVNGKIHAEATYTAMVADNNKPI